MSAHVCGREPGSISSAESINDRIDDVENDRSRECPKNERRPHQDDVGTLLGGKSDDIAPDDSASMRSYPEPPRHTPADTPEAPRLTEARLLAQSSGKLNSANAQVSSFEAVWNTGEWVRPIFDDPTIPTPWYCLPNLSYGMFPMTVKQQSLTDAHQDPSPYSFSPLVTAFLLGEDDR